MSTVAVDARFATDASYEPDLDEYNAFLAHLGAVYKAEMSRRTVLESELFPVNQFVILAQIEDYLRTPQRLRTIAAHATPGELAGSGLPIGTQRNFFSLVAIPLHYLAGRELLLDLDMISPASDLEDHLAVLEFWRQATIARRVDGVLLNSDAGDGSRVVSDAMVQQIAGELIPAQGDAIEQLRRFGATLTAYCVLESCDTRLAVCDTGPYESGDPDTYLVLRELATDRDGHFPWTEGLTEPLPHHQFVIAYEFPRSVEVQTNLWGLTRFEPNNYLDQVRALRVYRTDNDRLEPLTVAELDPLSRALRKIHRTLYRSFAEMSSAERTLCAAQVLSGKLKSWATAAGCVERIDWELSPRVLGLREQVADSGVALEMLSRVFVPQDRPGCFRPLR